MADRFNGNLTVGGKVTQNTFYKFIDLIKDSDLEETGTEGSWFFNDCRSDDFEEVVAFCKANNISLCINWDAKYEYDGLVEYWLDGGYHQYKGSQEGNIVVPLYELEAAAKTGQTIDEFIANMNIPEWPDLEIIPTSTPPFEVTGEFHDFDNHRAAVLWRDAYRKFWNVVTVNVSDDKNIYRVQP